MQYVGLSIHSLHYEKSHIKHFNSVLFKKYPTGHLFKHSVSNKKKEFLQVKQLLANGPKQSAQLGLQARQLRDAESL